MLTRVDNLHHFVSMSKTGYHNNRASVAYLEASNPAKHSG